MNRLEHRIPPPLVLIFFVAAMAVGRYAIPITDSPWFARLGIALVFFFAAAFFGPPAIRIFRRVGTTINPVTIDQASTLVTTGVFARTRNPMYVSMLLLLLSWSAWLGQWPLLLGPTAFFLFITRFQIIPEERAMQSRFGQSYLDYQKRVRRWL